MKQLLAILAVGFGLTAAPAEAKDYSSGNALLNRVRQTLTTHQGRKNAMKKGGAG